MRQPVSEESSVQTLPEVARRPAGSTLTALVSATRPRQWTKSLLVLAAPFAGGSLLQARIVPSAVLSVLAFTAAAAGVYLLNDIGDRERDRLHPTKRLRPVASGRLRPTVAVSVAVALCSASLLAPLGLRRPGLAAVIAVYLLLAVTYSRWLKHVPGVELLVVAAGFLLRPVAGAIGTGVPASGWFLIVCTSGALAIGFGKRYAELRRFGALAVRSRPALAHYRVAWLLAGRRAASAVAIAAYLAWAATPGGAVETGPALVSALPFIGILYRYAMWNDREMGESPEELVLTDRPVQLLGLVWLTAYVIGILIP